MIPDEHRVLVVTACLGPDRDATLVLTEIDSRNGDRFDTAAAELDKAGHRLPFVHFDLEQFQILSAEIQDRAEPNEEEVELLLNRAESGDSVALDELENLASLMSHRGHCARRGHPAAECTCCRGEIMAVLREAGRDV